MKTLTWQNRAPKTQNNFFSISSIQGSVWLVSGSFCALDDAKSPRPLKILSSLVSPLLVSSLFYFIGPRACLFILLLRAHTAFPFFSAQTAYCENLSWGNVSSDCADIYLAYVCIYVFWLGCQFIVLQMLHCVPTELHSEADLCSLFIGRTLRCVIISTLYSWMEDSVVKVLRLRGSSAYVGYGSTKVDSSFQLYVCVHNSYHIYIYIYISVHEKSCDDVLCTTTVGLFVCIHSSTLSIFCVWMWWQPAASARHRLLHQW